MQKFRVSIEILFMVIWHCPIPKSTTMFTPTYFLLLFTKVLVHNKLETIIKKEKNEKKKKSKTGSSAESLKSTALGVGTTVPSLLTRKPSLKSQVPRKGWDCRCWNVRWGLSHLTHWASRGKHALPTICLKPPRYDNECVCYFLPSFIWTVPCTLCFLSLEQR